MSEHDVLPDDGKHDHADILRLGAQREFARHGDFTIYGVEHVPPFPDLATIIVLTTLFDLLEWNDVPSFFMLIPAVLMLGRNGEPDVVVISRFSPTDSNPALVTAVVQYWVEQECSAVASFEQSLQNLAPDLPSPVLKMVERQFTSLSQRLARVEGGLRSLPPPIDLPSCWAASLIQANGGESPVGIQRVGQVLTQRGHLRIREAEEWQGGHQVVPRSLPLEIAIGAHQFWRVANIRLIDCDWKRMPAALETELERLAAQMRWLTANIEEHPSSEPFPERLQEDWEFDESYQSLTEHLSDRGYDSALVEIALAFLKDLDEEG